MKQCTRGTTTWIYTHILKPIFFKLPPDFVHNNMIRTGRFVHVLRFVGPLLNLFWAHRGDARLHQTVFGMQFENPVGLSAGLDKNAEIIPMVEAIGFGFGTVGSITASASKGNARPLYHRLPKTKSLVVNAGLPNQGAAAINRRISRYSARIFERFHLVASVAKTNSPDTCTDEAGVADYVAGVKAMQSNPRVAMIELNISCPNAYGGEPFTRVEPLEQLLKEVDALNLTQSVTVKMPIDKPWEAFDELLAVIARHNVAAVTIGNLQKNRSAIELKDPLSDETPGNLSGKPCFEDSNNLIAKTYQKYGDTLKIIGVGGIFNAEDAYRKIKQGATLVELITGMIFTGPQLIGQINHDLSALLAADGYDNVAEAIGADNKK